MTEPEIHTESDRVAIRAVRLVIRYMKNRKKASLLTSFDGGLREVDPKKEILLGKSTQIELMLEMLLSELSAYRFFLRSSDKKTYRIHAPEKAPSLFILFTEQEVMYQKVQLILRKLYRARFPRYANLDHWVEPRKEGNLVIPISRQEQLTATTIGDLKKGFAMPLDA